MAVPNRIYLISCGKRKLARAAPAAQLYQGRYFKALQRYACAHMLTGEARRCYILSAKYHLLDPSWYVAPYETTLGRMPIAQRRAWSREVARRLQYYTRDLGPCHYVILAGRRYWEHLVPYLGSWETPLAGLGIGQQLQWLSRNTPPTILDA